MGAKPKPRAPRRARAGASTTKTTAPSAIPALLGAPRIGAVASFRNRNPSLRIATLVTHRSASGTFPGRIDAAVSLYPPGLRSWSVWCGVRKKYPPNRVCRTQGSLALNDNKPRAPAAGMRISAARNAVNPRAPAAGTRTPSAKTRVLAARRRPLVGRLPEVTEFRGGVRRVGRCQAPLFRGTEPRRRIWGAPTPRGAP